MSKGLSEARGGEPMLEVRGIVKTFGRLTANDHVSLSIGEGEIHALLGENGAGKSTLVKMLFGSLEPDCGEIRWHGQPVTHHQPVRRAQDSASAWCSSTSRCSMRCPSPTTSCFRSIAISREATSPSAPARFRSTTACRSTRTRIVGDLSVGERQRIEIVRCLLQTRA